MKMKHYSRTTQTYSHSLDNPVWKGNCATSDDSWLLSWLDFFLGYQFFHVVFEQYLGYRCSLRNGEIAFC